MASSMNHLSTRCRIALVNRSGPYKQGATAGRHGVMTMNNKGIKQFSSREEVQAALNKKRDLSGADLSNLDLAGFKLVGLNAEAIKLSSSNLHGGVIMAANMASADLSEADLAGAVIGMSNLGGADFHGANLRGAKFQMCNLDSVDFSGADLKDTLWIASNIADADFSDAPMDGAKSSGVSWVTAGTRPDDVPDPLLFMPRWAPFAVLGLVGSFVAFLFMRRRRKTGYISLDEVE
jgi:hypothetical protein